MDDAKKQKLAKLGFHVGTVDDWEKSIPDMTPEESAHVGAAATNGDTRNYREVLAAFRAGQKS